MYSFDRIQYPYIVTNQGHVFFYIDDYAPNMDSEWFITRYMKSRMRYLLDEANPKYANMPAPELVLHFLNNEPTMRGVKWKIGTGEKLWDGLFMQWIGHMYAHYQWEYNVSSSDLIDMLPVKEIARVYYPLHEIDYFAAAKKIHDEVLNLK